MASTLILGGARSGKSALGENLALASGLNCIYLATAEARDQEMVERITHHQDRRGTNWKLLEKTTDIANVIKQHSQPDTVMLIDCLTLWTSNLMEQDHNIPDAILSLEQAINAAQGDLIFVANEVGLGIVPMNKMARDFRDHAGRINQAVAATVDTVYFCIAGLPLTLKQNGIATGGTLTDLFNPGRSL
jgi:adenosylcobinamide kinase/adenosylcobinamide-phosphate guanylyltransferase